VYSDSLGQFFLRVKTRAEHALIVQPEQSLNPGLWQVVSAPASALSERENVARQILIVVRRVGTTRLRTPALISSANYSSPEAQPRPGDLGEDPRALLRPED
jgi:hypothetical protein